MGAEFLADFNRALLQAEAKSASPPTKEVDAFGLPFAPLNEPMPKVKLGGGFDASLRTMFKAVPCQYRYNKIEGDAYSLSKEMRSKLRDALEWVSSPKHREVTWTSLSPDDILFAYPNRLPQVPGSFVKMMRRPTADRTVAFEQEAKNFLRLFSPQEANLLEDHTDRIQIFVLHKVDKGRSKVVYAHNTTPAHIFRQSQLWAEGCRSHPALADLHPPVLYPIQAAEVLNWIWKQDGTLAADKFRPLPLYRGIELFFGSEELTAASLRLLVQNTTPRRSICRKGPCHAQERTGGAAIRFSGAALSNRGTVLPAFVPARHQKGDLYGTTTLFVWTAVEAVGRTPCALLPGGAQGGRPAPAGGQRLLCGGPGHAPTDPGPIGSAYGSPI